MLKLYKNVKRLSSSFCVFLFNLAGIWAIKIVQDPVFSPAKGAKKLAPYVRVSTFKQETFLYNALEGCNELQLLIDNILDAMQISNPALDSTSASNSWKVWEAVSGWRALAFLGKAVVLALLFLALFMQ